MNHPGRRVLMIDNYDSFTFNVVQAMRAMGADVITKRNDELAPDDAALLDASHLVVSPGPGRPQGAGETMGIIERLAGEVPILGICLGLQAIAAVWGAPIRHAARLMHGKPSPISHDGQTIYAGIPSPCVVGRYHSLCVQREDLSSEFEVSGTDDSLGELMSFRHRSLPIEAVQYHPESVLTPEGNKMIANFLGLTPPASLAMLLPQEGVRG